MIPVSFIFIFAPGNVCDRPIRPISFVIEALVPFLEGRRSLADMHNFPTCTSTAKDPMGYCGIYPARITAMVAANWNFLSDELQHSLRCSSLLPTPDRDLSQTDTCTVASYRVRTPTNVQNRAKVAEITEEVPVGQTAQGETTACFFFFSLVSRGGDCNHYAKNDNFLLAMTT